jgi:DNA processing protein
VRTPADDRADDRAVACAAALAGLPEMWQVRLHAALRMGAELAWSLAASGRLAQAPQLAALLGEAAPALGRRWADAAADVDPIALLRHHEALGVRVLARRSPAMPACFATDEAGPELLFVVGEPELLAGPTVAVVGTRRCTRYGRDIAAELGAGLAAAGVTVVSGLALGIDTAAHAGALAAHLDDPAAAAPPAAVVGTGVDVPYPRRNGGLWRQVGRHGVLLSEYPLGTPPAGWRFPTRNRLIAAAADLTVVVESHERGGALITAEEAMARGRQVLAVPGPMHAPASAGSHRLLADLAQPCLGVAHVLTCLHEARAAPDARVAAPPPADDDAELLDAFGWEAATVDQLVLRTGRSISAVSLALVRLTDAGLVAQQGGWYERCAR